LILCAAFSAVAAPKIITWGDLSPVEKGAPAINFDKFGERKGMPTILDFGGSQIALDAYVDNMEFMRQMQPQDGDTLAIRLNGREIKIAGYVTPLSFDGDKVVDFLFVPYLGACIHVPPPAVNQIVYVENATGLTASNIYEPLWLTGKLTTTSVSTLVANVGYSISGAQVEPYKE
jgi:hypothetical protein